MWRKTPFVIGRADYHWQHEVCWYGYSGTHHPWYGGRDKGTVWDCPKPQVMDGHPTMKPVELFQVAVQNSSKVDDIILDPFVGSGTTIIAAEMTGRSCHAIEISPAIRRRRHSPLAGLRRCRRHPRGRRPDVRRLSGERHSGLGEDETPHQQRTRAGHFHHRPHGRELGRAGQAFRVRCGRSSGARRCRSIRCRPSSSRATASNTRGTP